MSGSGCRSTYGAMVKSWSCPRTRYVTLQDRGVESSLPPVQYLPPTKQVLREGLNPLVETLYRRRSLHPQVDQSVPPIESECFSQLPRTETAVSAEICGSCSACPVLCSTPKIRGGGQMRRHGKA